MSSPSSAASILSWESAIDDPDQPSVIPVRFFVSPPHSTIQPSLVNIPEDLEKAIDKVIKHYPVSKRSAVLPVLHLLQEHFRYITPAAIEYTATKLELEPIKVLEVVTFYPGFREGKPGKYHIRVCRTLSCAMAGSGELMDAICKKAGIDRSGVSHHHPIAVSKDGKFSIEFAECLASCGSGPVCLVNDDFHENVVPEKAKDLLKDYS